MWMSVCVESGVALSLPIDTRIVDAISLTATIYSTLIMAEGENDWIIEDSEGEDQLSSSQPGRGPTSLLLPGAHIPG